MAALKVILVNKQNMMISGFGFTNTSGDIEAYQQALRQVDSLATIRTTRDSPWSDRPDTSMVDSMDPSLKGTD